MVEYCKFFETVYTIPAKALRAPLRLRVSPPKPGQTQKKRCKGTSVLCNAQMSYRQIKQHCAVTAGSKALLKKAVDELGLSARTHDKILKVARTISDLEASADILPQHICEAIQYRRLDRDFF